METITREGKIGAMWDRAHEAIRGTLVFAPSSYYTFSYGGFGSRKGGASDNWDEVAVAFDLINAHHGHRTIASLPAVAAFMRAQLADREWMQKEFGSWIYLKLHSQPRIVQYVHARELAKAHPEWVPIAADLRVWLRAMIGWLAVTGCWGPGKTWTSEVAHKGPGAMLMIGRGEWSPRAGGAPYCVLTGKRSWDFSTPIATGSWRECVHGPILLSDLGLGVRGTGGANWLAYRELIHAVEGAFGPLDLLGADESALVLAATRNDVGALQWCVKTLIGDWLPAEPVEIIRSEHGVSCTMLEAGQSSTATMMHCGWDDDGTTYAASGDMGLRGGRGEFTEAGRAQNDIEARTGWCERTSGEFLGRVTYPLPQGPLVAVLRAQHGVGLTARWYRNGVEERPAPPPPPAPPSPPVATKPRARRPGFWARLWARLFGAITIALLASPGAGEAPHVYLAVTGTPPTQELWLERAAPLPPLKLNGPLQTTEERGLVNSFAVSDDGQRVAYTANARVSRPLDFELWSVPITGPPETRLNANLISDYDVSIKLLFDESGNRIIYRVGRSSTGPWDLYSALYGFCCGIKISHAGLPMGRDVRADFEIRPGGWVRFSSDVESDSVYRWYMTPVVGVCVIRGETRAGADCIVREIFTNGFESGNLGGWS